MYVPSIRLRSRIWLLKSTNYFISVQKSSSYYIMLKAQEKIFSYLHSFIFLPFFFPSFVPFRQVCLCRLLELSNQAGHNPQFEQKLSLQGAHNHKGHIYEVKQEKKGHALPYCHRRRGKTHTPSILSHHFCIFNDLYNPYGYQIREQCE